MNKPYFTKYLPVEGEIKEGDMMMLNDEHPQGKIRKCWYIHYPFPEHPEQLMIDDPKDPKRGYGFCHRDEVKKVKLFLCSRDIQVGDNTTKNSLEPFFTWDLESENDVMLAKKEGFFKVIGEVSPAAVWVKEGMEFEEEDIKIVLINQGYIIEPKQIEHVPDSDKDKWLNHILFKCPTCNIFH